MNYLIPVQLWYSVIKLLRFEYTAESSKQSFEWDLNLSFKARCIGLDGTFVYPPMNLTPFHEALKLIDISQSWVSLTASQFL